MLTRLDNLVLAVTPIFLKRYFEVAKPPESEADLKRVASGIVGLAWMIEQAIADEELRQMTPPKGDLSGP